MFLGRWSTLPWWLVIVGLGFGYLRKRLGGDLVKVYCVAFQSTVQGIGGHLGCTLEFICALRLDGPKDSRIWWFAFSVHSFKETTGGEFRVYRASIWLP